MRTTVPVAEDLLKTEVRIQTTKLLTEDRLKQKIYHNLHAKPSSSVPL